jgi:hypothetical protein
MCFDAINLSPAQIHLHTQAATPATLIRLYEFLKNSREARRFVG